MPLIYSENPCDEKRRQPLKREYFVTKKGVNPGVGPNAVNLRETPVLSAPYEFRAGGVFGFQFLLVS